MADGERLYTIAEQGERPAAPPCPVCGSRQRTEWSWDGDVRQGPDGRSLSLWRPLDICNRKALHKGGPPLGSKWFPWAMKGPDDGPVSTVFKAAFRWFVLAPLYTVYALGILGLVLFGFAVLIFVIWFVAIGGGVIFH